MMISNNNFQKFFSAAIISVLLIFSGNPLASFAAGSFSDTGNLPEDEQTAIDSLVDAGVLNGKGNNRFAPFDKMTRAEVAKVIAIIRGLDTNNAPAADFTDTKGHWAEKEINAVAEAGIVNGKGNGKFDPNGTVKRSEFAKMIVEAYDIQAKEGVEHTFTDLKNDWSKPYIETLFSNGLISGKTKTRFAPDESIQRNHVALLVYRTDTAFGLTVESVTVVDADTLSVKFSDTETVDIDLETPLSHEQTEVTFEYKGKKYTVSLQEPYQDEAVLAVKKAEQAIQDLPESITLEEEQQVEEARGLVEAAFKLNKDADIQGLDKLKEAEEFIAKAKDAAKAVKDAEEAIEALPGNIALTDEDNVKEARSLVDAALQLDAEASINKLDILEAAENRIKELLAEKEAEQAIAVLPANITLADQEKVAKARAAVDHAFELNAQANIKGLATLEAAESKIEQLVAEEKARQLAKAIQDAENAIAALPCIW